MVKETENNAFKQSVKQACVDVLTLRMNVISQAMDQAQDSANNQEKSSAGDKHETARAIGQAERDMNARQLLQVRTDLKFLESIYVDQIFKSIAPGAMFQLDEQLFFVALGLGAVKVNDKTVMVISHLSPLFINIKSKQKNDVVLFQNKETVVRTVF